MTVGSSSTMCRKIGTKKVMYIVGLTSAFWFSLNVLLMIATNETVVESIAQLNTALNHNVRRDSHFMSNVGVKPLEPARRHDLPWLKVDFWTRVQGKSAKLKGSKDSDSKGKLLYEVYDVSKKRNKNPGLGENGDAAYLNSDEEKKEAERLFANHSFNSVLSNQISLDRVLLDVRGEKCKTRHLNYPYNLPTASVVICFHNEAYSVLLRTVHSVLNRTPPRLLKDIILVDDASLYDNLKAPLDDHVEKLSKKVKIIRNRQREGLIRSRLRGAATARGEVIVFLDSHCETTPGWIEPLLARIKENRSNVVVPVIEVLSADTLQYMAAANPDQRGGFGWDLFYKWKPIPPEEQQLRTDETDFIRYIEKGHLWH